MTIDELVGHIYKEPLMLDGLRCFRNGQWNEKTLLKTVLLVAEQAQVISRRGNPMRIATMILGMSCLVAIWLLMGDAATPTKVAVLFFTTAYGYAAYRAGR